MKAEYRFRLIGLIGCWLLALLFTYAAPSTDLYFYDRFTTYTHSVRSLFGEIFGPDPTLHCSLVLLGERETRDLSKDAQSRLRLSGWGVDQDLRVCALLHKGGARAIVLDRDYSANDLSKILASGVSDVILPAAKISAVMEVSKQVKPQELAWSYRLDRDEAIRSAYLAVPGSPWTPTLPLVLFADYAGVPLDQIVYSEKEVRVGKQSFPVRADGTGLAYLVDLYEMQSNVVDFRQDSAKKDTEAEGLMGDAFQEQSLEPVPLQELLSSTPHALFRHARGRYFFLGDFRYDAEKERRTFRGKYRDFQLIAATLDSLIRGWHLRWLKGPSKWGGLLLIDFCLIWILLSKGRVGSLFMRSFWCLGAMAIGEFALISQGLYFPFAAIVFSLILIVALGGFRLWANAIHLLHRFGGQAAAAASRWGFEGFSDIDERWATILFINLPDYFKSLERSNRENLFQRRKEFSTLVATIADGQGGIIHDYQGDALMIGFGTNLLHRDPDHGFKAVVAARQLQLAFHSLSDGWLDALDPEELKLSAGICSGVVAVGFVGAEHHKKAPAAIGDTTNVAARLLGAARKLNVDVLISKPTFEFCGTRIVGEELPPVQLKGKSHPVEIFKVVSIQGTLLLSPGDAVLPDQAG